MTLPQTDPVTNLLTKFLNVQSRRAETVASNLANADTPGYKAKRVEFADFLREAARVALEPAKGQASFIETPRVVERESSAVGLDGNSVETGRETAELSEAGMQYLAGTQLLQSRLRTLRAAIREGR